MINENSVDEQLALQKGTGYESGLSFEEASLKRFGYQVINEVTEYLSTLRERPVWQPMPGEVRETIRTQVLPEGLTSLMAAASLQRIISKPHLLFQQGEA